jgi:hypothetical protein
MAISALALPSSQRWLIAIAVISSTSRCVPRPLPNSRARCRADCRRTRGLGLTKRHSATHSSPNYSRLLGATGAKFKVHSETDLIERSAPLWTATPRLCPVKSALPTAVVSSGRN